MLLVEIPLPNLLAGNVSLEILSYRFFQIFFGSDFPPNFFGYFFKESLKTKNEPKNLWRDLLCQKNERNCLSQKPLKRSLDHSLEKNPYQTHVRKKSTKESLKNNVCKKNRRQISMKHISEDKCLQKIEDASPPKNGMNHNKKHDFEILISNT